MEGKVKEEEEKKEEKKEEEEGEKEEENHKKGGREEEKELLLKISFTEPYVAEGTMCILYKFSNSHDGLIGRLSYPHFIE